MSLRGAAYRDYRRWSQRQPSTKPPMTGPTGALRQCPTRRVQPISCIFCRLPISAAHEECLMFRHAENHSLMTLLVKAGGPVPLRKQPRAISWAVHRDHTRGFARLATIADPQERLG
jgi:hypothetical protein